MKSGDLIALLLFAFCCSSLMCCASIAGGHTCTRGTWDTYDFDSDACFDFSPAPGPGPGPGPASTEEKFPDDITGLTGRYTLDSYEGGQWKDLSGKDNHATVTGELTEIDDSGVKLLRGEHTVGITFPEACMNPDNGDYTLAYVGKYAGDKRGRIFDGKGVNWLSGWHGNRSGYAHHGAGQWVTEYNVADSKHGQALMMGVDQKNLYRSQGKNRTKIGYTNGEAPTQITINAGMAKEGNWGGDGEVSDFALGEVLIWNRELSDVEISRVEGYLSAKYFPELETPPEFIGQGWHRGGTGVHGEAFEPVRAWWELSGSQEHCRKLAEKGGKAVWGHRNEAHGSPHHRNTCWFYETAEGFDGYVDDSSDTVHTMGCADITKDVHTGCQ